MTDGVTYPSAVRVAINGASAGIFDLPDDPADHRGVLSWFAQTRSDKPVLDEAGSYGYLVTATVPRGGAARRRAAWRDSCCASKWTPRSRAGSPSTVRASDGIPSGRRCC